MRRSTGHFRRRAEDSRLRLWLRRAKEDRSQNGRDQRTPLLELEINGEKYPVEKARGSAR